MSVELTEKELIEFLKVQKEQIDKLQNEREELKIAVMKFQTLQEQAGPVQTFLGITRDFKLDFFERRRFIRLMQAAQDNVEVKSVFQIGKPGGRFYLDLTYPQLTGLIKLVGTTIAALYLLFTTGSLLGFRISSFFPI